MSVLEFQLFKSRILKTWLACNQWFDSSNLGLWKAHALAISTLSLTSKTKHYDFIPLGRKGGNSLFSVDFWEILALFSCRPKGDGESTAFGRRNLIASLEFSIDWAFTVMVSGDLPLLLGSNALEIKNSLCLFSTEEKQGHNTIFTRWVLLVRYER